MLLIIELSTSKFHNLFENVLKILKSGWKDKLVHRTYNTQVIARCKYSKNTVKTVKKI